MKNHLLRIGLVIFLFAVGGCGDDTSAPRRGRNLPPPPGQSIRREDVEKALQRAQAEGKKVFIDFSADQRCPPCRQMKSATFSDPAVQARLAQFVTLFVDVDKSPGIARQIGFDIDSIPAYVVMRPDRGIVNSGGGYKGPTEFLRWLDESK